MGTMRRVGLRAGAAGAGLLVAIGAAGCGGGGGSHLYTLAATRACLDKAGYQTTPVENPYLPGSAGNLRVKLSNSTTLLNPSSLRGSSASDEYVFLVFDKSLAGGLATEQKAVTLAVESTEHYAVMMTRAAAKAGVGLTKNVFYYSDSGALTQGERTKITSCLN
jgi:hypothetical protein